MCFFCSFVFAKFAFFVLNFHRFCGLVRCVASRCVGLCCVLCFGFLFCVCGCGFVFLCLWFCAYCFVFRILGLGFEVLGLGFRVCVFRLLLCVCWACFLCGLILWFGVRCVASRCVGLCCVAFFFCSFGVCGCGSGFSVCGFVFDVLCFGFGVLVWGFGFWLASLFCFFLFARFCFFVCVCFVVLGSLRCVAWRWVVLCCVLCLGLLVWDLWLRVLFFRFVFFGLLLCVSVLDVWFCCWGLWFGVRTFLLSLYVCDVCFVWFRLLCGFGFVALRRVALGCVVLCFASCFFGWGLVVADFVFFCVLFFAFFTSASFLFVWVRVMFWSSLRCVALRWVVLCCVRVFCFWFGVRGYLFSFFFVFCFGMLFFFVGFGFVAWGLWCWCFFCFCRVFVFAVFVFCRLSYFAV